VLSLRTHGAAAQVCMTDTDVQAALAGWAEWLPGMPAPVLPRQPSPLAAAWARASPSSTAQRPASQATATAPVLPPPDATSTMQPAGQTSAPARTGLPQSTGTVPHHSQAGSSVEPAAQPASRAHSKESAPERSTGGSAFSQMMQAARTRAPPPQADGRRDGCAGRGRSVLMSRHEQADCCLLMFG